MPRTFLARAQETSRKVVEEYRHQLIHKEQSQLITPTNATSQSRDTQMGPRLGHKKVTIDRAIAICRARRPQPHGPQPQHPCHRQIKAIISRHRR